MFMKEQNNKINNYSIVADLVNLVIYLSIAIIIGYLFNELTLSILIFLSIYIVNILYSQYIFERWIFNYQKNKSINYHHKHQYLVSNLNQSFEVLNEIKLKFKILEKRFKELSASMPDAVVVVDNNFVTDWFNDAAIKMLTLKDIDIGRPILHLIRNPNFTKFINSSERPATVNFTSPLKYDVTIQSFLVPYGEDRYLLTFRDVSESDHLDKMRRDFVANVSHELKTPLTVIFGYLETISLSDQKIIDQGILDQMLKQATRMDVMISDLLKLTKLQTTNIPKKNFSPINLKNLVNELLIACEHKSKINKNNIKVLTDADLYIQGSYEEIYSAFLNLLLNAIMYSGLGVIIEIDYFVSSDKEVIFSIKDYGVGIPLDSVDRLTERFYRVDKGRSREQGGTGLGLSIVKHIMNRHQGTLKIKSSISKGSQFSCVFPKTSLAMKSAESSGNI